MIEVHKLDSKHLAKNLLGNPSVRDLVIYLPPSYSEQPDRRYPVYYLLHGFATRSTFWECGPILAFNAHHRPLSQLMDEAIVTGQCAEMLYVAIDGWSRFGNSLWVDSPVTGEFEQYVAREVVAYVDANFRTLARPESRGLTGNSAGASGAWHIATSNPDVFGAFAMLGGGGYSDVHGRKAFYDYYNAIYPKEPNGPIEGFQTSFSVYASSTALTPNVNKPPFFCDFPIEYPSGRVLPELWAKRREHDPVVNWEARLGNIRRLRAILLDCGWRDEFNLVYVHRILSKKLSGAGVRHDYEEFDGPHTTHVRDRVIFAAKWFSQVLDLEQPKMSAVAERSPR